MKKQTKEIYSHGKFGGECTLTLIENGKHKDLATIKPCKGMEQECDDLVEFLIMNYK